MLWLLPGVITCRFGVGNGVSEVGDVAVLLLAN